MTHGESCSRYARLAQPLAACTSTPPAPQQLAGHYELVGVIKRGAFEAVLYYGSLDIRDRERWARVHGRHKLREHGPTAFSKG